MKQPVHPSVYLLQVPVILFFIAVTVVFKKMLGPMSLDQQRVFFACTVIIWAVQCYAMIIYQDIVIDLISCCDGSSKARYKSE